jgi:hypothetical protein
MALAAILGMCLLLFWPRTGSALAVPAMRQATQSQDSQPSNTPKQQGATSTPAASTAPCPETSKPGSSVKPDCKPVQSTGTKTTKHHHKTVAPAGKPAGSGPSITVVPEGSAADQTVDLSPGLSPQQASRQITSTNQLLATSETNLKKLEGRQLSANQQDTVNQIKSYMEQAKTAANSGDAQRAYNLAVKANLLSAELAGH